MKPFYPKKEVCAIVVTYNGMKWIDKCLSSLLASSRTPDIIVIDNQSNDGTVEFIASNFPQVHLITHHENIGFGNANNLGLRWAYDQMYRYFFLLNQDAWVDSDTVFKLMKYFPKEPYGILAPVQYSDNGSHLDSRFKKSLERQLKQGTQVLEKKDQIVEIDFVNAAAWMLSRECLEKVGVFHPFFFQYGEDKNYCHRVLFNGLKVGILTSSWFCHDRSERTENNHRTHKGLKLRRKLAYEIFKPRVNEFWLFLFLKCVFRVFIFSLSNFAYGFWTLVIQGFADLTDIRQYKAQFCRQDLSIKMNIDKS